MHRNIYSKESNTLRKANENLRFQLIKELGKEAVDNDKQVLTFISLQYMISLITSVSCIIEYSHMRIIITNITHKNDSILLTINIYHIKYNYDRYLYL